MSYHKLIMAIDSRAQVAAGSGNPSSGNDNGRIAPENVAIGEPMTSVQDAAAVVEAFNRLTLADSGKFLDWKGEVQPL